MYLLHYRSAHQVDANTFQSVDQLFSYCIYEASGISSLCLNLLSTACLVKETWVLQEQHSRQMKVLFGQINIILPKFKIIYHNFYHFMVVFQRTLFLI
jgi:hypothetical protein